MRVGARLPAAQLALLSGSRAAGGALDGKYSFQIDRRFHGWIADPIPHAVWIQDKIV
jgi:hypothetical protein